MSAFAALRHRNFRLLWTGQLFSVTGTTLHSAAALWHVSLLAPPEQKALALGAVGLVRIAPILVFSILGGMVADARDRRRVLYCTQSLLALSAAVLAALTFSGRVSLPWVYVMTAISAALTAFDAPARQSLGPSLVPREVLPNAVSLNFLLFQTASVAGPALAGLVVAARGVGWAYALDAVSFSAPLLALAAMRELPAPSAPPAERSMSWSSAQEGIRFVFGSPLLRSSMLLDFFATFFGSAMALLPIYAQDILDVGARGYGWLYAAPAIGAALTSLVLLRGVERIHRRGPVLLAAVAAYGLATIGFGLSRTFWPCVVFLALTGITDTVSAVIRNLIRQLETPDHLRGRMVSVNMLFFMGGPQLGELEAGVFAHRFGAPAAVWSGGLACLLSVAWIAARTKELRRYRRS